MLNYHDFNEDLDAYRTDHVSISLERWHNIGIENTEIIKALRILPEIVNIRETGVNGGLQLHLGYGHRWKYVKRSVNAILRDLAWDKLASLPKE
jgi:hypothetical protein